MQPSQEISASPPNISHEHVFCSAPGTENASLQILFKCPTPAMFFWKCDKALTFCSLLTRCTILCACHAKRHLKLQKWREHVVFCKFWLRNVLRATTACTFSTSQLPKVVRPWCVLYILTSKCASRQNDVHFFDISTTKSGLKLVCFVHFNLKMCFVPQRRAIFISYLARWLRTRRFSEPTFRPSGAPNHWKKHSVSRLSYLFARLHLLSSETFSFFFSSLLFSDSSHLCFSSVHIVGSLTPKLPSIRYIILGAKTIHSPAITLFWKTFWGSTFVIERKPGVSSTGASLQPSTGSGDPAWSLATWQCLCGKRCFLMFFWCFLMFLDVSWCCLMFPDVSWCFLMFLDVFWCFLMFPDVSWCLLMFLDVSWCFLMFPDVSWCFLMFPDVSWCFLMFPDVSWCFLMFLDVLDVSWCFLMFLDVSWCFLMFLDVSWCFLMFPDVSWCFLMFLDVSWCCLMFLDVYWCFLMFLDVYWCFLMFLDVSWCFLMFLDVSWCFLMFLDVSWCFLMFLDVSWCFLMFLDVSRCFLMFLDVSWCFLMLLDVSWWYMWYMWYIYIIHIIYIYM